MSKTKIKKSHIQEAFWLIVVIAACWALISMRSGSEVSVELPAGSETETSSEGDVSVSNNSSSNNNSRSVEVNNNSNASSKPQPNISQKPIENMRMGVEKTEDTFVAKSGKSYPLRVYKPLDLPNDTDANQWWVEPTGMEEVWEVPAGDTEVTIAVIDTGFALDHEEFTDQWATNSSESGSTASEAASQLNCTDQGLPLDKSCNNIDDNFDGIVNNESGFTTVENPSWLNCTDQSITLDKSCNRIDDDENGLVDDWRGWDFSNYDHSVQAGETNPDGEGTTHGTMTAGTLGATGDNNVGIAGVNWHAKILPIQALDDDEYGDSLTVGESVYYAVDQGADVISVSLGTVYSDPYMRDAILYAMDNDVAIVAASGNDGCNCMVYPANYPEVVAAGASNPSGSRAGFSSYGNNLDIIAPGQDMIVPTWSKNNQSSAYADEIAGTSFSTPFVAGVLGLMRSHQPDASWDEIVGIMAENSDRKNLTSANPHSSTIGFGSVVASSALDRASQAFSPFTSYRFDGKILGSEKIKQCEQGTIPGSFLYKLSKNKRINYTINQYEKRKKVSSGWSANKLFGLCVGLPTDTPDFVRLLNLTAEIQNKFLKQ